MYLFINLNLKHVTPRRVAEITAVAAPLEDRYWTCVREVPGSNIDQKTGCFDDVLGALA